MTQKHTPGPWKIEEIWNTTNGEVKYYVKDDEEQTICDLYFTTCTQDKVTHFHKHLNDEANAALIAAAPDLLEALKVARNAIKELPEWLELKEQVNSAIAKAEGK